MSAMNKTHTGPKISDTYRYRMLARFTPDEEQRIKAVALREDRDILTIGRRAVLQYVERAEAEYAALLAGKNGNGQHEVVS